MAETEPIVSTEPTERKPEPWNLLLGYHEKFLTHLECIVEMFELVLPLLKKQDEIRVSRIKELSEEVVMEGEKVRRFEGDIREFLTQKFGWPNACSVKALLPP